MPRCRRGRPSPASRPLVDEKMGWQTGVDDLRHRRTQPATGRRRDAVAVALERRRQPIAPNRSWIILAVLMLAGLGAGILIAMQSG